MMVFKLNNASKMFDGQAIVDHLWELMRHVSQCCWCVDAAAYMHTLLYVICYLCELKQLRFDCSLYYAHICNAAVELDRWHSSQFAHFIL